VVESAGEHCFDRFLRHFAAPIRAARIGPAQMPDTKLLHELFLRNRRGLLSFLTRRVGRDAAPDLMQEAFARLLSRDSAADIVDHSAYLRRTAGNLALDFVRRRRIEQKYLDPEARAPDAVSEEASAELRLDEARRAERLAQVAASLPPRCREIFEMRVRLNMSQRDIAAELGISRKTVEQHFHLAMERCRSALK
jgi:RNA polymerase sigma factor (sigma-70 family)